MVGAQNPWDVPEWHYIGRECALVRHLIGSGATAIGRANYADQKGEYYTAFFGLSVGLERLAKLILVADHAISNSGQMPSEKVVRKYGHKLPALLDEAEQVARRHGLELQYGRPVNAISKKALESLDAFADASRGRYANFAALGDPNLSNHEPIRKWWGEVAELILKEHYFGKPVQRRIEGRASVVDAVLSPVSLVLYIDETGATMRDVLTASIRTGQTDIVQRFGRFYLLAIARWLAEIYSEIARAACYNHNIDAFFGSWELFQTYTLPDSFLKTRKIWPLT